MTNPAALTLFLVLAGGTLFSPVPLPAGDKDNPLAVEIKDKLTDKEPKDTFTKQASKVHEVKLTAGKTYVISMDDANDPAAMLVFDPYLRLEDAAGKELARDDDSGGKLNARITFPCAKSDTYKVVATCLVGTGSYVLRVREAEPAKGKEDDKVHTVGKDGLKIAAQLTRDDAKDPVLKVSFRKAYTVKMVVNKTYTIDMVSKDFDAFLRLEDATGKELARDDDSGGDLNARIIFRCPADGDYRIIATSFGAGVGNFTLQVREE